MRSDARGDPLVNPTDLMFQSVKDGHPMRDNIILTRFIKPAAWKLSLEFC